MERTPATQAMSNSMEPPTKKVKKENVSSDAPSQESEKNNNMKPPQLDAATNDEDWQPSWLPEGCSIVRVPVLGGSDIKCSFAFPANLIYDNLASLLGLKVGNDDSDGGSTGGSFCRGCLDVDSNALVELQITSYMCEAYVAFRAQGFVERQFTDLWPFMLRLAVPDSVLQDFLLRAGKCYIANSTKYYIESLGGFDYDQQLDSVGFFKKWCRPRGVPRHAVLLPGTEVPPTGMYVLLHESPEDIEAMRKRVQKKVWEHSAVKEALAFGNPKTQRKLQRHLVSRMMEERLPFYNIPLLDVEPEEDAVVSNNTHQMDNAGDV
ncbi:expressed unknown protein [Seminavis robusta]|uniref:Uncharacterized protein n=1 Tax=Seminavis robusta TaxID=568900 RepID=A0A9N8HGN3_9STRA|nr:expressed unknown protein [Seminavis robusta]|eukprot:Sro493_g154110.1 n/a (321) ;mRNA; f:37723-38685